MECGIDVQRPGISKDCFLHLPEIAECIRFFYPPLGKVRIDLQCLAEGLDGLLLPAQVRKRIAFLHPDVDERRAVHRLRRRHDAGGVAGKHGNLGVHAPERGLG